METKISIRYAFVHSLTTIILCTFKLDQIKSVDNALIHLQLSVCLYVLACKKFCETKNKQQQNYKHD